MKSLITGGAGFIGSNLAKALVERGDDVTVLDDFSVGKIENLSDIIDRIKIVKGSVCDIDLMRKLVSKNDRIFHLAVQCLVMCNNNPILANETNVNGTFNVCLASSELKKKVIYISSSEVYGTCIFSPMQENHPLQPQSIYGFSKLMSEEYVRFFNKHYNLQAIIIRPFNTYGPNHRNDQYSGVITSFIRQLENGKYPIIEGSGEQSRDFTYVSDTVEGIILISELEGFKIVNIGNGKSISIKELAEIMLKIYGMEKKFIFSDKRPNDIFKLEAGIDFANYFGYEPKVSIEEGLKKYIEWWRKNR